MHELILLIYFLSVRLRCKSGQTLLMHINPQWLVGRYTNIDPQVKLVAVNKQWICNVLTND